MYQSIYQRKLTFKEIFSLGGEVLQRRGTVIVLIAAIVYLITELISQIWMNDPVNSLNIYAHLIMTFVTVFINQMVPLAIIAIVGDEIYGRELDTNRIVNTVFRYLLPALLIDLMAGIILLFAGLLLVVPAVIVGTFYAFIIHSLVLRDKRGYNALEYSWNTVKGDWFRVFGLLLINGLTIFVLTILLSLITILNPIPLLILQVGLGVISSLFTVVQVIMFENLDFLKRNQTPSSGPEEDEPVSA